VVVHEVELVFGLLVAVAALGLLAKRIATPYPIVLVIGGLLIGLLPFQVSIHLEPEIVFLLFLPPLLYVAAFFTSIRDFRANAKPILSLAIGLVLATTAGVAIVAKALVPDLSWGAAFALGAIVSPPDAVAATTILRQLHVPRSVVTVLEGESLLNDATGLVAYRFAVAATLTGTFSIAESSLRFVYVAVVGVAIGLAVGFIVARLRYRLQNPPIEILISLLTPFAAYLPAETVGASGVLAAVACGLYLGRSAPRIMGAETRVQGRAVWDMLVFVLNGLIFILIGLQLPGIVANLAAWPVAVLIGLGAAVSAAAIVIRFVWVFATDLRRVFSRPEAWREDVVVSWAGMRGVVSLAAALALPLTDASGAPFPERDLLIFLTVCVILVTLVGQGLSLPLLLRALRLGGDDDEFHEEVYAREAAAQAARERVETLAEEWPDHLPLIDTLRSQFDHRISHLGEHTHDVDGRHTRASEAEQEIIEHRAIRHAVIEAERDAILGLREQGEISDDVWRVIEREIDLEELRMEA
jgi:monovalent cation/hydrogen antiporter